MNLNRLLILVVFTLNFTRYGMVFPLVPLLAHGLGASPAVIGVIVGAFGFLSFFLAIPVGGFADRVGVKRALAVGVLCNIISALLLLRADHVFTLMASQVVAGLGFQIHIVASQAFIASLDSPLRRESEFGYLTFSAALGQSLGPVLGGVLASRFGYHGAFLGVLLVAALGLMIMGFRETRGPRAQGPYSLRRDLRHASSLLSNSGMLAILAVTFVVIFTVSLRTSFLPVLLLERGSSEALVGLLISLFAGTSTLIRPFIGSLLRRFGRRGMLAVAILAVVLGVGLIPMLSSVFTIALALCTFGLGFGLTQPLSIVMVADLADPRHSGLSMGIRFMAITLANILGPVLLGVVVEGFGLHAAFYVSALFVIVTGGYILSWKSELLPGRREAM
jgi:predicted MFS family arabinose efflux permease